MIRMVRTILLSALFLFSTTLASAQPLGTFRWQQQPYCNVLTLNVVQAGAVYQLDGFDDQCGAATRASVAGLAFLNPDGSVGLGFTLVTTPGGTPLHIDATVSLATISGTWRDSAGNTGPFVLTPGTGVPGGARPVPRAVFPSGMSAGGTSVTDLANPIAATDASNKGYVDAIASGKANVVDVRSALMAQRSWSGRINFNGTKGAPGRYTTSTSATGQYQIAFSVGDLGIPFGGVPAWVVSHQCNQAATVDIPSISTSISAAGQVTSFGANIAVRNGAGTNVNCALMVQATLPHPDAPGSPVPPFLTDGSQPGVTCTVNGDVTTCTAGSQR